MSDNTSKEECPWHVSMTHACAWLLGALSKEVRRRKCSNCLTPTITKQSNLIPGHHIFICALYQLAYHLLTSDDVSNYLQISPTSSKFGKEVGAWRKYLEIVSTADRTINRYFFLVCQVGRISQTAYICSFAVPQLRWWIALVMEQNIYILANNLTYPWRIVYW